MSRIPVYVGLDYHSRAVQVCIEDEGGQVLINRPCDNDWRAIAAQVDRLGPDHEVVGCAIEACCGAADLAEKLVREAGWPVDLAHPGYVARMSPRNASSGQRQADAGLIKAGNSQLRAVLIQAAHRLILHHPRWAELAGQLREAGKPTNVIVAAVANRWIRWLYHQMQPKPAAA